jgi:hypothetical protein
MPISRGNSVFKSRWISDFGDFYFLQRAIGFNADLKFGEWIEQIKARKNSVNKKYLDYGLWRFVLGATESYVSVPRSDRKIKVHSAEPHRHSFVKLCDYLRKTTDEVSALKAYLTELKMGLDEEIPTPENRQKMILRSVLDAQDLQAIESECTVFN